MSSSDSEADDSTATLVPAAVQHIYKTGCPSHRGVKDSVDARERPSRAGEEKEQTFIPQSQTKQTTVAGSTNYQLPI